MKSKREEEGKKAETDFYEWWDTVEFRMIPTERTFQPLSGNFTSGVNDLLL
jgi:hypothetical protein